jgi:hypothetical protein
MLEVSILFKYYHIIYIDPVYIAIKKNIPAPGHYGQGIEINKTGKYHLSTI